MSELSKEQIESLKIVKNAISLLETVPTNEWDIHLYTDGVNKCCAIGHYQRLTSDNPSDYSVPNCSDVCNVFGLREAYDVLSNYTSITSINNGNSGLYQEIDNPKDRTLTALKDVVAEYENK